MKRALSVLLLGLPGHSCLAGEAGFVDRLAVLRDRIEVVSGAIGDAEGYPLKAGRIDLQVARFFADYVAWELEHPQIMIDALAAREGVLENRTIDRAEQERRYRAHIDRELRGSMMLLDQASRRLDSDGPWPEIPDLRWDQMALRDGYFRVAGRPVFPAGFNMARRSMVDLSRHPEWAAKDEAMMNSFLGQMRELGVGIVEQGISIAGLVGEGGRIREDAIRKYAGAIDRHAGLGFKVDILFHWSGDREILEGLWPGITRYSGNGVGLDIDHPGSRELIRQVMAELMPVLRDRSAIISWDMANEPFFSLGRWSSHGLRKYRRWLAGRHGTIERLNEVWKTDHASFEAIPLPGEKPRAECSAGEWYDRITFHNQRVTSFFGFIEARIREHVPDAVVHLKAQDNSSLGPLPDAVEHGIDRENLTSICRLQGVDTRPLPVTEPRMAASNYDEGPYGFHWLGQSFLYDYLSSLPPARPIVDFEYHAFSINAIRLPEIPASHAGAALWMAHLHGMIGNVAWYWHRRYGPDPFPGKYFKAWLDESLSTQPLLAAAYLHTMLQLNVFAREVEALASVPDRPLRLLVSKPSYIRDQAHINALHRAYEGSCFHGLRVGFVTEKMLAEGGVPRGCRMIVMPDAGNVSRGALVALREGRANGLRLICHGSRKPRNDAHGRPHAEEAIRFLDDVPVIADATAPALSREIAEMLLPLTGKLPLQVKRADRPDAFGVMHRQAKVDGRRVILLVNVFRRSVRLTLSDKDGSPVRGYDLLNREEIDGSTVSMPFQGVRLIEVAP